MIKVLYVSGDEYGNRYFERQIVPYTIYGEEELEKIKEYLNNGKISLELIESILQEKKLNNKFVEVLKNNSNVDFEKFREEIFVIYNMIYNNELKEFIERHNLKEDEDFIVIEEDGYTVEITLKIFDCDNKKFCRDLFNYIINNSIDWDHEGYYLIEE